jgi:hypothetical protein
MTIQVQVGPPLELGEARRCIPFSGGNFAGRAGLSGTVAPGGVDWQRVRRDGALEIDAHYTLLTDRNEAIEVRSTGIRRASAEVLERMSRGESVDPDEYYFRTHVTFSTAAADLAWLNDLIAVSTGQRDRAVVHIHVHEIL